jgi:hypothetical protein
MYSSIHKLFLALFLTIMVSAPAKATTYYVAKSGSDSGSCTQASPCLTIGHAYNLAAPGDVITVGTGTYSESLSLNKSGSAGNLITIQGFAVGGSCPTAALTDPASPVKTRPNPSVTINGASVTSAYNALDCFRLVSSGIMISAGNVRVLDNYIDGTNISSGSVGINTDNGSLPGPSNVYVAHNYVQSVEYGFLTRASNSTFEFNEMNGFKYTGSAGDCDYNRVWGDSDTFRRNYYHGMNLSTMCVNAAPHVDCFQTFYYSPGNEYSRNHVFDGNTCLDYHEGFMASNTGGSAGDMSNWTAVNNLFGGGDFSIWCGVFDGHNFTVTYNNNDCYQGFVVSRDSWGSGGAHLVAQNNIFSMNGSGYPGSSIYYAEAGGAISGSGHNYQYVPGYTMSGVGDTNNVNPQFINTASNDFHLKASSPVIGHATNVGLTADHDGNPRPTPGGGYDVGAYQSASSSSGGVNAPSGLTATVQ